MSLECAHLVTFYSNIITQNSKIHIKCITVSCFSVCLYPKSGPSWMVHGFRLSKFVQGLEEFLNVKGIR